MAASSTPPTSGSQRHSAEARGCDGSGQLTAPSYTVQGTAFNNVGGAVNALDTALSSIVGGSTYVRVNGIGPGASATGTNATAIGSGSSSSGHNSIAFGTGAQATQTGSIAVGFNSSSTGTNSIAIGTGATATGSVAIGAGASAANGGAALRRWRGGHRLALDRGRPERVGHRRQFGRDRLGLHQYRRQHRLVRLRRQRAPPDQCCRRHQPDRRGQCRRSCNRSPQDSSRNWEACRPRSTTPARRRAVASHWRWRLPAFAMTTAPASFRWPARSETSRASLGLALGLGYAATNRLRFNASVSGVPSQGSVGGTVSGSITLN